MKFTKCQSTQKRAKKIIPGMTQLLSKRPDMFAPGVWPGYYKRAKGAEIWDLDDNHFIDMSISGIGANVLGYSDPDVDQSVISAITNGSSSSLNCPEEVELAEVMCELHPWADLVRFSRCGGEAMSIAIRIARAATGKDKVAFCGYHGWHDWYLAANLTDKSSLDDHLIAGLAPAGVPKALAGTAIPFTYNDLESLENILKNHHQDLGAIVMEPIRNIEPEDGFWSGIRALADEYQIPLILDEISMGFRTNCGGIHLPMGIEPDIAVFSKALGNGYPIAAIIGKSKYMEAAEISFISSTMWTERIGPVAALACINKFREENVATHLQKIGKKVQKSWINAAAKVDLDIAVSGIDCLPHFVIANKEFLTIKAYFVKLMLDQGFLASNMFYAMYAHTDLHVEQYAIAVEKAFRKIKEAIEDGNLQKLVQHGPAVSGFKRIN